MKFPNELVCSFATLLPLRMLFRLALVCTRWRAVLLSCPELWTRIHITFGQQNSQQDLWKPLMAACISRSQDLQLVVDLKVGNNFRLGGDPNCVELVAVSDLLSDNMHRVKSLSVSFRFAARSPPAAPPTFLRAPAPVLRVLCLHVRSLGIGDALTIRELFSGHAPKLDRVELNGMIVILGQPFMNLPTITQLCFKRHDWDRPPNEVLLDLLEQLPSLQRLTLDSQAFTLHPPCLKVLDVQIHVPLKWDAFIAFPNARSVCYALGGIRLHNQWDSATANLEVVLQRYVQRPVRSLEMRLGPPIFLQPTGSDVSFGMTVKVDGVYIAVDADWIRDSRLIASTLYLHNLERLVLHNGNWVEFMDLDLPRLRELTVYLHRTMEQWPLQRPSSQRPPWALSLLRFARTLSLEKGAVAPLTLKAEDIATLVRGNFEPLTLETLALRGYELSAPGIAELRALFPHARIIFEETLEDDCLQPSGWPTSFVEPGGMVV